MNYDKMNQAYDHYVTKYGQQQNYVINFKPVILIKIQIYSASCYMLFLQFSAAL